MEIERLDHLGIVAGIGREIGLVDYFDELDTQDHERVSLGQAVLAMILNGLGFSNRQLYLVPQFFATKPVAHLLGAGIMAEVGRRKVSRRAGRHPARVRYLCYPRSPTPVHQATRADPLRYQPW